jgi:hypothetical protein
MKTKQEIGRRLDTWLCKPHISDSDAGYINALKWVLEE